MILSDTLADSWREGCLPHALKETSNYTLRNSSSETCHSTANFCKYSSAARMKKDFANRGDACPPNGHKKCLRGED